MTPIGSKIDKIDDHNFASPKRKDCKLDTDVPSLPIGRAIKPHTAANGKRTQKTKTKKPQEITKYFDTNGHSAADAVHISTDADSSSNGILPDAEKASEKSVVNEKSAAIGERVSSEKSVASEVANGSVPTPNGCLMSPEAKSLQNGAKQTTPHRIVIRTSPTKKQRIYAKDPVEVFSNLNIRDGAGRIGQKTCRKLNVSESENRENATENGTAEAKTLEDVVQTVTNGENDAVSEVKNSSQPETNGLTNNDKLFTAPTGTAPRRVQSTQLTDFFPIRRSGRKTKQAVEQEISQHIEMAIEKQLEDGLVVKDFGEKGRGIIAGRLFQRGEFVVEYIGELIDQTEADRREEKYSQKAEFGCYMYYFKHKEQQYWWVHHNQLAAIANTNLFSHLIASTQLQRLANWVA